MVKCSRWLCRLLAPVLSGALASRDILRLGLLQGFRVSNTHGSLHLPSTFRCQDSERVVYADERPPRLRVVPDSGPIGTLDRIEDPNRGYDRPDSLGAYPVVRPSAVLTRLIANVVRQTRFLVLPPYVPIT